MRTIINYTLYFSRADGLHPFLYITTMIEDKAGHVVHSHSAVMNGEYEWQRRELWTEWQKFKAEKADMQMFFSSSTETARNISITKAWES